MSFRISRELWIRIGDAVRRAGSTTQAFCTEAIERHLALAERKQNDVDDVNGKSAKAVIRRMRNDASGAE